MKTTINFGKGGYKGAERVHLDEVVITDEKLARDLAENLRQAGYWTVVTKEKVK